HLSLGGLGEANCLQGGFDRFAVRVVIERQHPGGHVPGGHAVDVGDLPIHLLDDPSQAELGHSDSGRIAVRGFGEPADEDSQNAGRLVAGGRVVVVFTADDVGVHAGTADVLSDLVDDQQVGFVE